MFKNAITKINDKTNAAVMATKNFIADHKANEPSSYVGLIIVALIVIGLLIFAVNEFFPDLFGSLKEKALDLIGKIDEVTEAPVGA